MVNVFVTFNRRYLDCGLQVAAHAFWRTISQFTRKLGLCFPYIVTHIGLRHYHPDTNCCSPEVLSPGEGSLAMRTLVKLVLGGTPRVRLDASQVHLDVHEDLLNVTSRGSFLALQGGIV